MEPDIRTLADLPFHVMGRFQNATVVGSARGGTVRSVTGKEFFEGVRDLSLGLSALGMEAGERVAIIAESRPEWLSIDLAILAAGAVTVPYIPPWPPLRSVTSCRTPLLQLPSSPRGSSSRRFRRSDTSCRRSRQSS